MQYILGKYREHKTFTLIIIGLLAVSFIVIPYVWLGTSSYIQLHDQMDGEILNYIYQAKYFASSTVVYEFMNGMSKLSMTPPAPFGVLFYMLLEPFIAYVGMQAFVLVVGYLGMFFLCKELQIREEIACLIAILFCYMPFYPTYGLSALGQPMLVLAYLMLWKGQNRVKAMIAIVIFAGFSSLTLVGYVPVALSVILLIFVIRRFPAKRWDMLLATVTLTAVYVITNLSLIQSVFWGTEFVSHREEMVLVSLENWRASLSSLLLQGGSYSNVYSTFIILFMTLSIICACIYNRKLTDSVKWMLILSGSVFVCACLAIMWNTIFVEPRIAIGGFVAYFQADRVYWVFPFVWMLVMAFVLQTFVQCMEKSSKKLMKGCFLACMLVLCLVQGYQIFRDSTLNKNIRLMLVDGYEQITWESFYMSDVFDEIEQVIDPLATECVVSLGMYPSIALYHGYTCADGYSNNYDLDYKAAFREIIAVELSENEVVREYFDDWGNRLYLVESEYGFYETVAKASGIVYEDVSFDLEAMKALNIRYIFSAAPISWEENTKVILIEESPFSSDTSYYEVWIYEIL